MIIHCTQALAAVLVGAAAVTLGATARAAPPEQDVNRDLARLSGKRILFGHQSVGSDILSGIEALVAAAPVRLRVAEMKSPADLVPGTLGHVYVAENGRPASKLRSFERALEAAGSPPDIAFVKFCFVDIGPQTDIEALFAQYHEALRGLRTRYPRTTFVHVTVPLTTIQSGPKAWAKRLLGRPTGLAENAQREDFNMRLRATYEGREPVFDLARLESTRPDGRADAVRWKGRDVPSLVRAYTQDGGHLNELGRSFIARRLVAALAALP